MSNESYILVVTAASIGFFHTLLGPDHYLPFILLSQSGKWSIKKTTLVTVLCGLGHVLSSIVLGVAGIVFGLAVTKLVGLESFRGNIAAWGLIAFGLLYFVWGLRQAIRNKPHKHTHAHQGGIEHQHTHTHSKEHAHAHIEQGKKNITPWVLFIIFVLGPCEPLIPLLMYPAAKNSTFGLILVSIVFGLVTILTMLGVVLISTFGISFIPVKKFERYAHALAGAVIFLSGISIQFLGL